MCAEYDMQGIGLRLKMIRGHLTQTEAAARIGISISHYSKAEAAVNGLSDKLLRRVAEAFNVNEGWLRTGEGDRGKKDVNEDPATYTTKLDYALEMRQLREMTGLSTGALAYRLGLSENTVRNVEAGYQRYGAATDARLREEAKAGKYKWGIPPADLRELIDMAVDSTYNIMRSPTHLEAVKMYGKIVGKDEPEAIKSAVYEIIVGGGNLPPVLKPEE